MQQVAANVLDGDTPNSPTTMPATSFDRVGDIEFNISHSAQR